MESPFKRKMSLRTTSAQKQKRLRGKDRFSELLDCLIHKILSFLETKHAVQTSVLSKRFKTMWTCVPVLRFNDDSFIPKENFGRFVAETLRHRNQSFKLDGITLNASCELGIDLSRDLYRCVSINNVQYLELTNPPRKTCTLPSWIDDLLQKPLCLPSLETLILEFVEQKNEYQADFFRDLPKLKNLKLICRYIENLFTISGPALINLTMVVRSIRYLSCVVDLNAPKLRCFTYQGFQPVEIRRRTHCSAPQNVCIILDTVFYTNTDLNVLFYNIVTMLRGLDGAKSMALCCDDQSLIRTLLSYLADNNFDNVTIQGLTTQMRRENSR